MSWDRKNIIRILKKKGYDDKEIARLTSFSKEQIKKIIID